MPKYLIITFVFLQSLSIAWAQDPSPAEKMEKLMSIYAAQQNWDQIVALETQATNVKPASPAIYHYLGEAFFRKENYVNAEKYLTKAHLLNSKNPNTRILLYYSRKYMGYDSDAEVLKTKMDAAGKSSVEKDFPVSKLSSLMAEAGIRSLSEKNIGGNITYLGLAANWQPGYRLGIVTGFNYLTQNIDTGSYNQPEIYIALPYNLGKNWQLTPAFHGAYNFFSKNIPRPVPGQSFKTNQYLNLLQLNIAKRMGTLTIEPSVGLQLIQTNNQFRGPLGALHNLVIQDNYIQAGLALYYQIVLNKNTYWLISPSYNYVSNTYINEKGSLFSLTSSVYYKKLRVHAGYMSKSPMPIADRTGIYYYNFPYKVNSNISAGIGYKLSAKTALTGTYQFESQNRTTEKYNLHYHSFYITLIYK